MDEPLKSSLSEFDFGGFWIRVLASLIDGLVLLIPTLLLNYAAKRIAGDQSKWLFFALQAMCSFFLSLIYAGFFQAYYEGTLGKKALGLAVVGTDGQSLSLGQAIGRVVMQQVCGLTLCIGYIWVGLDPFKQGWHDKVVHSIVVRKTALDHWRTSQNV